MATARTLLIICFTIISSTAAEPCSEDAVYKKENCIRVTPQREAEIQRIIEKISDYVDDLAIEHESFDIRLMEFAIERHTPYETEEKDVQIQVIINDCTEDETNGQQHETNGQQHETNGQQHETNDPQHAKEISDTHIANETSSNTDIASEDSPLVKPEVISLELDENGQELVKLLNKKRGKKRPIVVYIQSGKEYYFLRR